MERSWIVRIGTLVAVVAMSLPTRLAAQATPIVDLVGERVRVTTSLGPGVLVGEVASVTGDSLLLIAPSGATAPVAVADIVALERSLGRTSRAPQGMAWGAGVGIVVGGAGGVAFANAVCGSCDPETRKAFAGGALAGVFVGGLLGAVIGSVKSGEAWEAIEVRSGNLSIGLVHMIPSSGGHLGLTVQVRLRR